MCLKHYPSFRVYLWSIHDYHQRFRAYINPHELLIVSPLLSRSVIILNTTSIYPHRYHILVLVMIGCPNVA